MASCFVAQSPFVLVLIPTLSWPKHSLEAAPANTQIKEHIENPPNIQTSPQKPIVRPIHDWVAQSWGDIYGYSLYQTSGARTGELLGTCHGAAGDVRMGSFSPDSSMVLVVSQAPICRKMEIPRVGGGAQCAIFMFF